MNWLPYLAAGLLLGGSRALTADEMPPQSITHRIGGLFQADRADDLRKALKDESKVTLLSVDFDRAEATFSYHPKAFSQQSLGALLSKKAFEIRPPSTTPAETLVQIEIPVLGLDCKACSLGTYRAISKVDGVDRATASLKEGRVSVWFDPAKTNRAALEETLKKLGLEVKTP